MIPASREDRKKEAFRLFEDGRYAESLEVCTALLADNRDPAIEVLMATNLYSTGNLDDAEVFFRDLAQKMPESSYVHSYLGKVLEERGDEGAIAEYASAVHLDPTNQDALRSYADYLLSQKDYRAALPALRQLVQLGKKPGDGKNLMRALIETGAAREALLMHTDLVGVETAGSYEYIDALFQTKNFRTAAASAQKMYQDSRDPVFLRNYLDALSRYDISASREAYAAHVQELRDGDILLDYILFLKSNGEYAQALNAAGTLLSYSDRPIHRLAGCDLLAALGMQKEALTAYERLIRDEIGSKNDLDTLRRVIAQYRTFLCTTLPAEEAKQRFLHIVAEDVNVASLLETSRFYEDLGDTAEARAWYYRAFRAEFLTGGLEYARFLSAHDEERECEKVMLYILANVKKSVDLERVAAVIIEKCRKMQRLKRLVDHLIRKFEERRMMLSSGGRELLAGTYFIAASQALEERDYTSCKYYCLCGLDMVPAHSSNHPENFLQLIRICKEQSITDRAIMDGRYAQKHVATFPAVQIITGQLGLSEPEAKILEFLRLHRKASEVELRKVLGTRRVAGLVNHLIRKASAQGLTLIEKKGVSDMGEIYEYTGT